MTITLANGNTLAIDPSDDSARYAELTGDDRVELKFELPQHAEIAPGSSISFEGKTYYVERPQDVEIICSREYRYTCQFWTVAARLKHMTYINPDDGRITFAVNGTANDHLGLLVRAINELSPLTWTVGNTVYNSTQKAVSFDGNTFWEALEMIAEAFSTEFEFDGTAVYLRFVGYNKSLPLNLQYGAGNGLEPGIRRTNYGDKPPVVALCVKGGSRNLNTSSSQDAYDSKTLHMPTEINHQPMVIGYDGSKFAYASGYSSNQYTYTKETGFQDGSARYYVVGNGGRVLYYGGTIGISPAMPNLTFGTSMDVADLSEIYPNLTHTVTAVTTEQVTANGETFTQYTVAVSTNIDYNDALIPVERMTVVFQTGILAGRELEASFSTQDSAFTLVRAVIDDEYMPGGVFIPAVGDTFRVFGCMLPQQYIRDDSTHTGAEWEMAKAAVREMWGKGTLQYTWSADLDGIFTAAMTDAAFAKIRVGGYVSFTDPQVQAAALLIRIVGIKQPVNHPKWPSITLAEESTLRRRARIAMLEESLQRLTNVELQEVSHSNTINIGNATGMAQHAEQLATGSIHSITLNGVTYTPDQNGLANLKYLKKIDGAVITSNSANVDIKTGRIGNEAYGAEDGDTITIETAGRMISKVVAKDGAKSIALDFDATEYDNVVMIDNSDNTSDLTFTIDSGEEEEYWTDNGMRNLSVKAGECMQITITRSDGAAYITLSNVTKIKTQQ